MSDQETPKVFISYCWSSEDHQAWVLQLAEELCKRGVDVKLDKWDLKEGHDAIQFMESMVTSPEISKVILVFDKQYAKKADGRQGGVGIETEILTPEIYGKAKQEKFVAVIPERDEEGSPYLPTYYKSRIYIDFSDPDQFDRSFEKLLRCIFNKPLDVKPAIGKPPVFIRGDESVGANRIPGSDRLMRSIREDRLSWRQDLKSYLRDAAGSLEQYRIIKLENVEFDDQVVQSIEKFTPLRDDILAILNDLIDYHPGQEAWHILHRFCESLIPYMFRPAAQQGMYHDWDWDNLKFMVHELYLHVMGLLLIKEQFEGAAYLLNQGYYNQSDQARNDEVMLRFSVFQNYLSIFEHRNQRLKTRRVSIHADLLKERVSSLLKLKGLMQADLVLLVRDCQEALKDPKRGQDWWPTVLMYSGRSFTSFELFARAQSSQYFERLKPVLHIDSADDFTNLREAYLNGTLRLPSWNFNSINPIYLMQADKIGSHP